MKEFSKLWLTVWGLSPPQATGLETQWVGDCGFNPCISACPSFRKKRPVVPGKLNTVRVPKRRAWGKNGTVCQRPPPCVKNAAVRCRESSKRTKKYLGKWQTNSPVVGCDGTAHRQQDAPVVCVA